MARGFTSPAILFLNTWDDPERRFMHAAFRQARERGYRRVIEACCGSFVMPSVAVESGWLPEQLDTSDVSLFSSIVGTVLSDGDLDALDVRIDGAPVELHEVDRLSRAAELLYLQLTVRMAVKPKVAYWNEVRRDLAERRTGHIEAIRENLAKLDNRLHGIRYRPLDMFSHFAEAMDDPETVVNVNPPTYKAGFERFFDTKGRLTWREPAYTIFDPAVDVTRIMELFADKKALIFCLQQTDAGKAAPVPLYARFLAPGEYVYLCSNRPDEVLEPMGGRPIAVPKPVLSMSKLNLPIVPEDHEFSPGDQVSIMAVKGREGMYYRDLWMHKLDFKQASNVVAVAVGGYLVGMFGYDSRTITRPYRPNAGGSEDSSEGGPWTHQGAMLLTFAVGAAHQTKRLTRLVTMVALSRQALHQTVRPEIALRTEQFITVELTKHPEIKGLRGLMKLRFRREDPKYGYRLVYQAPMDEQPLTTVVERWLVKEAAWAEARQVVDRVMDRITSS